MNQTQLEDLHDAIVCDTHPEDTKANLATVAGITTVVADDGDGLLGDLFDAIMMCVGTNSDLDEPVILALENLVRLGYNPVPIYGANWKDSAA